MSLYDDCPDECPVCGQGNFGYRCSGCEYQEDFLDRLRRHSVPRSNRWIGSPDAWSLAEWACALAGEAGEVCNAVKKLNRVEKGFQQKTGPQTKEEALAAVASEIGDTMIYLDLLAARLGLKLQDCVRDTFNRVSKREGFPEHL